MDGVFRNYGIILRMALISDCHFILSLRTDPQLNQYLSETSESLTKQIKWFEDYKRREKKQLEYYFIVENEYGESQGTTRIYNLETGFFTLGSWLFKRDADWGSPIKADILTKEIGFETLGFDKCRFDVRKNNHTVIKYHKTFNPTVIEEDEQNFYFELTRKNFELNKMKFLNFFGYGVS